MGAELDISDKTLKDVPRLIHQGVECWIAAGKLIVQAVEAGSTIENIARELLMDPGIVSRFHSIGARQIYPYLLTSSAPGIRKLAAYDYGTQEKLFHGKVEFVCALHEGEPGVSVKAIAVKDLTPQQVAQVFGPKGVRTSKEQEEWLLQKKTEAARRANRPPYIVQEDKTVYFVKGARMSKTDIRSLLQDLE